MLQSFFQHIRFEWPWMLALLALVPLYGWWLLRPSKSRQPALLQAAMTPLAQGYNLKTILRNGPRWLRIAALALMVLCMARPLRSELIEINSGKGIEVMLCMDVSGSMLAQDFKPNRLKAAQEVANDFILKRKGDRIGLVVFAGQSLTLCPLTTDHEALIYQLNHINYGILTDGTAIGTGLATAVQRLRSGTAPSRVVVLLTDGEDTGGSMDPKTAREIARTYGVKVYTIGVGTEGYAPIPYQSAMGTVVEKEKVSIDEPLLQSIAAETGGQYFRAKDNTGLQAIYTAIDNLEKSDIKTSYFNKKRDAFLPILLTALLLLALGWMLEQTWLARFP